MNMHGLLKAHGGIMKMTAIQDYNCVKLYVIEKGFEVVEPKNTTKNRIENATAEMLHPMLSFPHYLNRGFSYYKSLIK